MRLLLGDHVCREYCKVHWYWDFQRDRHQPYPLYSWRRWVYIGPPAYYPKRPDHTQGQAMLMVCPHVQLDLTCSTCLRHTFRLREI